jgi:hypothetical protein
MQKYDEPAQRDGNSGFHANLGQWSIINVLLKILTEVRKVSAKYFHPVVRPLRKTPH